MNMLRYTVSTSLFLGSCAVLAFAFASNLRGEPTLPAQPEPEQTYAVAVSPTRTATPSPTATAEAPPTVTPTATPEPFTGDVVRLRIPRFEVNSAIEAIGVDANGQMQTPKDPLATGWYDPRITDWGGNEFVPGWHGNAVFAAHVTYYPNIRGPFYDLANLEAGDRIHVEMSSGDEYVYEVFFKDRYLSDDMPLAVLVWAPDRPEDEEWITLITCGGEFKAYSPGGPGEYLHRDVVIARRVN